MAHEKIQNFVPCESPYHSPRTHHWLHCITCVLNKQQQLNNWKIWKPLSCNFTLILWDQVTTSLASNFLKCSPIFTLFEFHNNASVGFLLLANMQHVCKNKFNNSSPVTAQRYILAKLIILPDCFPSSPTCWLLSLIFEAAVFLCQSSCCDPRWYFWWFGRFYPFPLRKREPCNN